MKGEDEKGRQNQQVEDKRRQFPYPIIWVPSHSEQEQAEKKDKRDPNADSIAEEPLSSFKFIPVKPSEIDDSLNKSENKKNSGDNPTGTSVRRQLSPQKTSKLPPVSLRVEPLSRKKNGDGSSRSLSPPGSNKQSQEKAKDSPRPSASLCLKENTLQDTQARDGFMNKSKEVEPAEAERKVVDMADDKNCEKKNEDWRSGSQRENSVRLLVDSEKDISRKSSTKETEKDSYKFKEDKRVREGGDMVSEMATEVTKASHSAEAADGERLKKIKNLSDVEAAMRIQSAYRGFEVRRMEPLKKLKQMADKNDRERDVIGEMIMRLLLKLDTIQGLHPSLRDIRKALAKELITLQETLDLLVTKKSKEVTKVSIDPKIDARTDKDHSQLSQNAPREENAANGVHDPIKTFKTEIEEKNGVKPSSEEIVGALAAGDALHVDDNLRVNELREFPIELIEEHPAVSKLEEVKLTGKGENEIEDVSGPNLSTDVDNMMACEVEVDNKTAATKEAETNLLAELPLGVIEDEPAVSAFEEPETNLLAELPLGVIEDEPAVSAFEEPETNLLAELPLGVIEDEPVVSAFGEHEQTKAGKDETLCHGEAIDNVATNTTALMEEEDLVKVMEELPVNAVPEVEEIQPLSSIAEGVKSDEVAIVGERGQEMIDVDHLRSLYSAVKNVVTEDEEAKCLIDEYKVEDELRCEFESTKEDAVFATPTSQKSLDEKDIVMERYKKLTEENAKLREMMQKLMEAGKRAVNCDIQLNWKSERFGEKAVEEQKTWNKTLQKN
ncbi:hypothetical protein Patl1_00547 [Pistacia atlantica]|uniref:Uncharacterized protein n=1 Tax=Pistacia atlantica TaxID=434234 RepID=A0ACC1C5X1_9ROSI|nr:hypothetical protein Patl1_00547 [Pistacia atlantica]